LKNQELKKKYKINKFNILFIYDSLSKKKKSILAKNKKNITLYLCGPTVYNHVHIGNIRSVIIFDLIRNLVNLYGIKVKYVHNITDVDDKIIDLAKNNKEEFKKITFKYTKSYLTILDLLKVNLPNEVHKISLFMDKIISFLEKLEKEKFTYWKDKTLYFQIEKIKNYYDFLPKKIKKSKKDDFSLWKEKNEEINWDSPWNKGRPGWHTECVVLIDFFFKSETISIHGGGIDLKFPHHTNERAQFLAINKKELANIWLHIGYVNLDQKKMSKSLNNVWLVKDFCQTYDINTLKLLLLSKNYKKPIDLNFDFVILINKKIIKWDLTIRKLKFYFFENKIKEIYALNFKISYLFLQFLNDDLKTNRCIKILDLLIKKINLKLKKIKNNQEIMILYQTFLFLSKILGFKFYQPKYTKLIKDKIEIWLKLKKEKEYEKADKIRVYLKYKKII
jgi:cysteinyl-tRNA synthetase